MNEYKDKKLQDDSLAERMRAAMDRISLLSEKVLKGAATESEIAEVEAVDKRRKKEPGYI